APASTFAATRPPLVQANLRAHRRRLEPNSRPVDVGSAAHQELGQPLETGAHSTASGPLQSRSDRHNEDCSASRLAMHKGQDRREDGFIPACRRASLVPGSDRGRQLMSRPEYLFPRGLRSSPRLSKLQQPVRSSRNRQSGCLRPWYACRYGAAYEVLRVTELLTPSVVGAVAALQRRREATQRPRMVASCPPGSGGSFTRLVPARSGGFATGNF